MSKYGSAPTDMGHFKLASKEVKFYLYLPIKIPKQKISLPKRLIDLFPVLDFIMPEISTRDYIYVTAKTGPVFPGNPGNRPGWHVDGYGSDGDLNFIWYDINPTEFAVQEFFDIPDDDILSMQAFTEQASNIVTYPCQHLLRLDESVVHRAGPVINSGMRSFVKITASNHKLKKIGNSHNYDLNYDWSLTERNIQNRNLDHG